MSKKSKNIVVLLINLFIVLSTIIITYIGVKNGAGNGQLGKDMIGVGYFKAFTIDSNVLMGICALVMFIFSLIRIFNKKEEYPKWVETLYLVGATSLTLTFFTVLCFIAPERAFEGDSFSIMYSGDMFFFHLINPVLAIISCCFFGCTKEYNVKDKIVSLIPAFIYSIVYLVMVVFVGSWDDFYNFTFGGRYYLIGFVMMVMYSVTYLFSFLLTKIHNKFINE